MALFHLHVTQVKRSAGQSVVTSAAYRAGEKLYSEYYGEVSDYTHKGGVVCTDILLPPQAPNQYQDRATLWNAVEKAERGKKAQLAYSFDIALQNEFSLEENIALARQFVSEQLVGRGMIADFAIHQPDKEDGGIPNPHFHVLCPIRPIEPDGKWGCKQRRRYRLDEDGNRIMGEDGKPLFDAVPTTDWGSPETLEHWREAWAAMVNAKFEEKGLTCRIDHRSYERQGLDLLPTVHEGVAVRQMEAKGMLPHMDRPADRKAGCKHRCTDAAMNYLKAEVMEMCHSEGLYQIDLLNGSKERITEREYWAQKKGQAALDRANAPIAADGIAPRQTKFETDKAKLRRTIREALAAASGFDEFAALLLRHGVTVKESRGRLSYLTPDRTKPITARKLGDDFDRAAVLSVLEQNAARAAEKPAAIAEYPGSIKDRLRTKKEAKNAPNNDAVQRMVDIAAKRAEGKGRGYEKWATMHNLKQMSAKSGSFQFIQRTLDRHGAAGQDCGNGCDREADKEDSVLVLLPFGEHSVQHPAVHDLCGAADWKSCQRSGKRHTGRQWCVYRHKFKIHSVCSSFFFARLDK